MKCKARVRLRTGKRRPSFVPCAKNARADHQTCWQHRDWDAAAEIAVHMKVPKS